MNFKDGDHLETDLIVFSAGIRPQDALGRSAGLELGPRGGIAIDNDYRTSDPQIFACGDMRRGQSLVVWAIREGRQAARSVDEALMGVSELPR